MSFFPFIEGIFYLSLGIIVVLIFLIVFHFKQRIENLEKKGFLLTEVYNNLLKEVNIMKSVVYSPPQLQQKQNIVFSTFSNETEPENNIYRKIVVLDKIEEDEDHEDEDEDEDEDDDEDEDEDEDDNDDDNDNLETETETETKTEQKEDTNMEEVTDLEVKTVDPELESKEYLTTSINVTKLDQEPELESNMASSTNNNTVSYSKLSLQEMKMLVISKGLSSNPSKMKRAELLKLLEEETI